MELTERLSAALDETERIALAAVQFDYGVQDWADDGDPTNRHIARHDPASVLRMVAAHRKILALHAPGVALVRVTDGATVTSCASCGGWHTMKTGTEWPCDTLLALAEAYGIEA